jgi:hypothetical protein
MKLVPIQKPYILKLKEHDTRPDTFQARGLFLFENEICDVYITKNPLVCVIEGVKTKRKHYRKVCPDLQYAKKQLRDEIVRRWELQNKLPLPLSQRVKNKITMRKILKDNG